MTPNILEFISNIRPTLKGKVLDVGSLDVNGTPRGVLGRGAKYTGVDRREGPNVDKVMSGHKLKFRSNMFDVVLCLDCLEHDELFWLTFKECHRVLKKGGRLVISVPGLGFPKHDHPSDFYRFTGEALTFLFQHMGMRKIHVEEAGNYAWTPEGVILLNNHAAVFGHAVK